MSHLKLGSAYISIQFSVILILIFYNKFYRGKHGVGRIDIVENRKIGMKSRGKTGIIIFFLYLLLIASTRRYLDAVSAFSERYGRQMDVRTILCAYWVDERENFLS